MFTLSTSQHHTVVPRARLVGMGQVIFVGLLMNGK